MKRRDAEEGTGRKKREWVLPVSVIGGVLLLCLVVTGVFLLRHYSGTYVRTSNGRHMVVFDDIGPVVLSTKDKPDRFDGMETGDRLIAVCGFLHETYPAQSDAKFVLRLWRGDLEEIPQKYREELTELGWLAENTDSPGESDKGFPDWGLTLSVKNITPTGLTLVCMQEGGNPTGDLQCGEDYHLIVLEDGTWKDVPPVIGNAVWDSLAYPIPKGQDTEFELSWEWLYGKLPAGMYRLTKGFMDFRETGDYDTAMYWVEFKISE